MINLNFRNDKKVSNQNEIGQENNELAIDNKALVPNQSNEIKLFIIFMIVFTTGMAIMLIYDVSAWWIWYIYFAVWTLIEFRIARNIKLKWWWWVLIIIGVLLVDFLVIEFVA